LFEGTVTSSGYEFTFRTEGSGDEALKRALGCMIVAAIPQDGLEEIFTSLRDIWEFHAYRAATMLPQPRRQVFHSVMGSSTERPQLTLAED
jgi:hypothetical protein